MVSQTQYWNRLISPGIVALVGAGGKTTVLSKLVEYGRLQGQPVVVTTTTHLYESQVAQYEPVYATNINEIDEYCTKRILKGYCGAWFSGVTGTKVDSVDCDTIDSLSALHPNWQIVVEADGAREKWLKAPKETEPVIPKTTKTTIGVVNLQMLGAPLDEEHVHNIELVQSIVHRDTGAIVTPHMLSQIVTHPQGLFQYSRGKKILFCTGYDTVQHRIIESFIEHVVDSDISAIVLADGYKASCEIRRIIQCR
ncbi:selenium cofactor biosynthesis protein YqeC [Veillonella agrestimuris]|uniref:selenium cofactor biosynthesis protein YqeC n=1 Tax=Veillonella agrestimuris TaxID=2941340 RepID=UPI00203BA62A|nr:selenium cofactor biosynthesis protein YqeC [Veillonella agrestimuris]